MLSNQSPPGHLSEDELLQALVDAADLATERRLHLERCVNCQKALEDLEERFSRFERRVRQMAPAPPKPFRLPQQAASTPWLRMKPVWATVLVAALVLAVAVWWPRHFDPSTPVINVARNNLVTGGSLLDQVDALVDDALPPVLQQLTVTAETEAIDSVIDWVVPPVEGMEDDDSWT